MSASMQFLCLFVLTYLGILFNIIQPPEPPQVIRAFLYIPQGPNPEPPPPPKHAPPPPPKRQVETAKLRLEPPEKPKMVMPPPPVAKPVLQPMNIPAPPALRPPKPDVVQGTFSQPKPVEAPKKPQGQVASASFGTPTGAAPSTPAPGKPVSTGGFGIGGTPQRGRLMLPQGGSIYHPVGFGDGSGGGGSGGGRKTGGGGVQVGGSGFDNTLYASAANPAGTRAPEAPPPTIPVEVLFKPKPEYTEAARREKIEGEVLLQALFTAAGQVTNIRIVQGLGHGLDEMAVKAAQRIQFKPAQRNGAPVDSVASIRIVFKLAY